MADNVTSTVANRLFDSTYGVARKYTDKLLFYEIVPILSALIIAPLIKTLFHFSPLVSWNFSTADEIMGLIFLIFIASFIKYFKANAFIAAHDKSEGWLILAWQTLIQNVKDWDKSTVGAMFTQEFNTPKIDRELYVVSNILVYSGIMLLATMLVPLVITIILVILTLISIFLEFHFIMLPNEELIIAEVITRKSAKSYVGFIKEQTNREIKIKTIEHRSNDGLPEPFLHGNSVQLEIPRDEIKLIKHHYIPQIIKS